jgi:hypothetical protein
MNQIGRGRTENSLKNLGVSHENLWTREEDEFLRQNYSKLSRKEILEKLHGRTWSSIEHRASRLGLIKNPPKTINPLTEGEKGYIAGIIDGEGSLGIAKHSTRLTPYLEICNTKADFISWLRDKMGLGYITQYIPKKASYNNSYLFSLIRAEEIIQVLDAVEPYLVIKKKHAELLKEFCQLRTHRKKTEPYTEREHQIYVELKNLNRRGRNV